MERPKIPCSRCAEARSSGDLEAASRCHYCKGTGIRTDPQSYRCNLCGGTMLPVDLDGVWQERACNAEVPHGLVDAKVSGGYDSRWLFDITTYTFSFCEKCLRGLFEKCAIKPGVNDYAHGGAERYEDDSVAFHHRAWDDSGGKLAKFLAGGCTHDPACPNPPRWRRWCSDSLCDDEAFCDAHRRRGTCSNVEILPIGNLGTIQRDPVTRLPKTREDGLAILAAWLPHAVRSDTLPTYWQHAPSPFDFVSPEGARERHQHGTHYAVWMPDHQSEDDFTPHEIALLAELAQADCFDLPGGKLYLGTNRKALKPFLGRELLAAHILPGLHKHERAYRRVEKWIASQPWAGQLVYWRHVPAEATGAFNLLPDIDDPRGEMALVWSPQQLDDAPDDELHALGAEQVCIEGGSLWLLLPGQRERFEAKDGALTRILED